jgi:glutathione S-transferase
MKLRYSTTSPYARKVLICALELGLRDRLDLIATSPFAADSDLPKDNPLGKVPVLITDAGVALYDSPVICEYLASLAPGSEILPAAGPERWQTLRLQALGDGIMDAALLVRLETRRPPEQQSADWIGRQWAAIRRGLDAMERECGGWADSFTIGQIAAACALGYLVLRFAEEDWASPRPGLSRWFGETASRTSFVATEPRD